MFFLPCQINYDESCKFHENWDFLVLSYCIHRHAHTHTDYDSLITAPPQSNTCDRVSTKTVSTITICIEKQAHQARLFNISHGSDDNAILP